LAVAEKKLDSKTHGNKVAALEAQLKGATQKIKDLEAQVKKLEAQPKDDAVDVKLKQALEKIDEQGRMINVLSQKLENAKGRPELFLRTRIPTSNSSLQEFRSKDLRRIPSQLINFF